MGKKNFKIKVEYFKEFLNEIKKNEFAESGEGVKGNILQHRKGDISIQSASRKAAGSDSCGIDEIWSKILHAIIYQIVEIYIKNKIISFDKIKVE